MKRLLLLFTLLMSIHGFGQTPVITMISDGDCSGGNPKVVEIYADGTVDFANYSLEKQSNDNTTWDSTTNLADLGVVTDDFVYIYKDDPSFADEFPSASNTFAVSGVNNFNGNDSIRIIEDASGNTIDEFGADGVDGSGEPWEYENGYAKRNNGTGPDITFSVGNWTFFNGALDGEGTCQGGTAFESIIGINDYTLSSKSFNKSNVQVYPNPVTDGRINIDHQLGDNVNLKIFSIQGKQVLNRFVTQNESVNVSNLKSGVYLINLSTNSYKATQKLIIK